MTRALTLEEKEAGYARQLKQREKQIKELLRNVELTKARLKAVE